MFKKTLILVFYGLILANLCGCVAIMGVLGDTAKSKQNINVSYGDTLEIVKKVLKEQGIEFKSADIRENIAEVKGRYSDDRVIRIIISKVSDTESRVSVRAGTSQAGKEVADKILKAIVELSSAQPLNKN